LNTENDGMSIEQFIRNFSPEVEKWAKQNIYKYIGWVGDSREGVNDLYAVGMLEQGIQRLERIGKLQQPRMIQGYSGSISWNLPLCFFLTA